MGNILRTESTSNESCVDRSWDANSLHLEDRNHRRELEADRQLSVGQSLIRCRRSSSDGACGHSVNVPVLSHTLLRHHRQKSRGRIYSRNF